MSDDVDPLIRDLWTASVWCSDSDEWVINGDDLVLLVSREIDRLAGDKITVSGTMLRYRVEQLQRWLEIESSDE